MKRLKLFFFWLFNIKYYVIKIDVSNKRVHIFQMQRNENIGLYAVTTLHCGKVIMPQNIHDRVIETIYYNESTKYESDTYEGSNPNQAELFLRD